MKRPEAVEKLFVVPSGYMRTPDDQDIVQYIQHLETAVEELSKAGLAVAERLRQTITDPALSRSAAAVLEDIHACLLISDKPPTEHEKQVPPEAIRSEFSRKLNSLMNRALNGEKGLLPELEALEQEYPEVQRATIAYYSRADHPPAAGWCCQNAVSGLLISLRQRLEAND